MKRLFPLLLLLVAVVMSTGMFYVSSQGVSPDGTNPVILTAMDDTVFMLVNGRDTIDVLANDVETNAGCTKILLEKDRFPNIFLAGPFHSNVTFRDSTYIDRGDVSDATDDVVIYVPLGGFNGKDSLKYWVGRGGCGSPITDSAWVFIYVTEAPTAQDDIVQVLPGVESAIDVLTNDSDPDGDPVTADSLATPPENGTAAVVDTLGSQRVVYTPTAGYIGPDSLQYYISDDKRAVDTAWLFITVNSPPVAVVDSALTLPGMPVTIDVLDNDTDPEAGALTIGGIVAGPANGTVATNGVVTYTPNAGFVGIDVFDYVAVDPLGGLDTASVVVTVNTAPDAVDDAAFGAFGVPLDIDVLANDTDADNDALTVSAIVEMPDNGTVTIIDGGARVQYTPNEGFFGDDSFVYEAADGRGGVDEAHVDVTISATARVQFIHNALPPGPVDLYVDDVQVWDGLDFRTATPYLDIPAGNTKIDITDDAATDNSAPFFSVTPTLIPEAAYVAVANGVVGQNFDVLLKDEARLVAGDAALAEFIIVHGVLDAPASGLDVRLLDPDNSNLPAQDLVNDINFEEATDYLSMAPALYNIDATNFNQSTVYNVHRFDLGALAGQTFTLVLSGLISPGAGDPGFAIVGFDADGNPLMLDVTVDAEDEAEIPAAFALRGNYPNPFNPTTNVQFDLPERAEIRIVVVDVLGRQVLTVPPKVVEAGAARSVEIDAAGLASGTYFYRLVAQTATEMMVGTGQMTLVK